MSRKPYPARPGRQPWLAAGAALLAAVWATSAARSQAPNTLVLPTATVAADRAAGPLQAPVKEASTKQTIVDPAVKQVGCTSCGGGLLGGSSGGCSSCGGGGDGCAAGCYPGARKCDCCINSDSCCGKFFGGLYECICCPDPCYEPKWLAIADAAFFVDSARPVTQMRLRYEGGFGFRHLDRAEYFWATLRTSQPHVVAANCPKPPPTGKGPACIPSSVDYQQLIMYNEAAMGGFSAFVEVPYRHIDPETADLTFTLDPGADPCCPTSGFADIVVGTKAVLLDCELLLLTLQTKTTIPSASPGQGLGTGHVALEPSLLFNLKLTPDDYIQGQFSYWIPLGGDQVFQGNIFHSHFSYNHMLWKPCNDFKIIATAEINEWSVLSGAYTADNLALDVGGTLRPVSLPAEATIVSAGPGIRMVVCDKLDLGVGSAFNFTGPRWTQEMVRADFRLRF